MITTNSYHMTWKLRATIALVLALALSTFPAVFSRAVKAQNPANATAETQTKATASTSAESRGGQKEGIKVHGHWTIEVRNPDGTLVTHREFENALQSEGSLYLAHTLSRQTLFGEWSITLSNQNSAILPCKNTNGVGSECDLWEHSDPYAPEANTIFFKTVTVPSLGQSDSTVVVKGSATAGRDGSIDLVYTGNKVCDASLFTVASCLSSDYGATGTHAILVTRKVLPVPVPVSTGQIIVVTVAISFS